MTKREVLQEIIRQDGGCEGIECQGDNCPMYNYCGTTTEENDLVIAKRLLAELDNEWKPLEVDNLPPDILTWKIEGDFADHEIVADRKSSINMSITSDNIIEFITYEFTRNDGWTYRYRLRKHEPTAEELAEKYAKDYLFNFESAVRQRIEYAYIAGYNEAKKWQ